MKNDKEYILCAAIKFIYSYGGEEQNMILPGHRHGDCFNVRHQFYEIIHSTFDVSASMRIMKTEILIEDEQGFLTSRNRFVDRAEARTIAIDSGLIDKTEYAQLFSEDLY